MSKSYILKQLHTEKTLEKKWTSCRVHTEKVRWQALLLLRRGMPVEQILEMLGRSDRWLREVVSRFNKQGSAGLTDMRKTNGGHNRLLDRTMMEELKHDVIHKKPRGGGLWTGVKATEWIAERTNKKVSKARGWNYLKRLNMNLLVARPSHIQKATVQEQADFKKNSKGQ